MKLIIAILMLALASFAQGGAYFTWQPRPLHSHIVGGGGAWQCDVGYETCYNTTSKYETKKVEYETKKVDTAFWYNIYRSSYCTMYAITPSDYIYKTFDYCENVTTINNRTEEFKQTLKIKACKESFKSKNKSKLYDYLEKCIEYTTIEHDSPTEDYTLCGYATINVNGTSIRPSTCGSDASWWRYSK